MNKNLLLCLLLITFPSTKIYAQWTQVGSVAASITLPSISQAADGSVWIAGGPAGVPEIYRSIDGGLSFVPVNVSGIGLDIFCIAAIDSLTAFAGDGGGPNGIGGDASMYKTTDGGNTWTLIYQTGGTAAFFNSVIFSESNPAYGIMQSDPPNGAGTDYYVRITKDTGATWDSIFCPGITGAISAWHSAFIVDSSFFGFGLNNNPTRICITKDGGVTWNVQTLNITGGQVSGLDFSEDKLRGLAASTSLPAIARTPDATTWTAVATGTGITGAGTCKWIPGTDICYLASATGSAGCVRRSMDGGLTWTTMTTAGINQLIELDFSRDTNNVIIGYAANIAGNVLKLQDSVLINPSAISQPTAKTNFFSVFPNPVSDYLNVQSKLNKSNTFHFEVYNSLGQKITNFFRKIELQGQSQVTIDVSALVPGLYAIHLINENQRTEIKKFIKQDID